MSECWKHNNSIRVFFFVFLCFFTVNSSLGPVIVPLLSAKITKEKKRKTLQIRNKGIHKKNDG